MPFVSGIRIETKLFPLSSRGLRNLSLQSRYSFSIVLNFVRSALLQLVFGSYYLEKESYIELG